MSELSLCGDGLDGGRVLSWMLYPNEPELRKLHIYREIALQACDGAASNAMISIDAESLRALIDGPGKDEIGRKAAEATKRGTVAGDLLNLIQEMHGRELIEPSFGKAIEEYKKFANGKKYGDGEPLKYSEQMLRNYFNEFRSVAHLWAAFRLNQGPYAYTDDPRAVFHSAELLEQFLGVAKGVQEFASSFIPKRAKPPLPIIELSEMVCVPQTLGTARLKFKSS